MSEQINSQEMITVPVSELTGPALDWAVAKCTGGIFDRLTPAGEAMLNDACLKAVVSPSTNRYMGAELIEKFKVALVPDGDKWLAVVADGLYPGGEINSDHDYSFGDSMLVAGCRAIVLAKFGETVQVPAHLVEVQK